MLRNHARKRTVASTAMAAASALTLLLAIPAAAGTPTPGAPSIGDPYYPTYGNGVIPGTNGAVVSDSAPKARTSLN